MEKVENQLLLVSAANGDVQNVIKSLSDHADINVMDANKYTPLQYAVYNNHIFVVQILIEAKANVTVRDTKNYDQWTPLHFAAAFGKTEIVKALLKTEQDPHLLNGKYQSPLDLAATQEIKQILENDQKIRGKTSNEPTLQPPVNDSLIISQHEHIPQQVNPEEDKSCKKKRNWMKFGKLIAVLAFFLCPTIFLIVDPYQFPWFIFPCGLLILSASLIKVKCHKEKLNEKNAFFFAIHAVIFTIINLLLIISNIWAHGYPWSVFVLSAWGCLLFLHSLKTSFTCEKFKNPVMIHFIIYKTFSFNVFILYSFSTCNNENCGLFRFFIGNWFKALFYVPVLIWGILVLLHFIWWKRKMLKERQNSKFVLEEQTPQTEQQQNTEQSQYNPGYDVVINVPQQNIQTIYSQDVPIQKQQNIYPYNDI